MSDAALTPEAAPQRPPQSPLAEFWSYFSANKGAVGGLVIVVAVILIALLAPVLAPHAPDVTNTALGYATYRSDEAAPVVDAFEVARASTSKRDFDVAAGARKFAGNLVAKLNGTPERTRPSESIFLLGVFATLGAKRPTLSSVAIYNLNSGFLYTSPTTQFGYNKIVTFGLDEALASQIAHEPPMRALARANLRDAEKLPAMIELLIQRAIDRDVSPDVGGSPTVLVIERGQRPRWHRKAAECPDQARN